MSELGGSIKSPFPRTWPSTAKNRPCAWRPCSDETLRKQPIRVGAWSEQRADGQGGMQGGGKEKRRYLERESGKVLVEWWCGGVVVALVDSWMWMRGSACHCMVPA
jgi:hypothetical protein